MAKVRYLSSTKKPGLKFKILGRRVEEPDDPEKTKVYLKLEGSHGVTFERLVSDSILEKYGYVVEVVEVPDGNPAPAPA